MTYVLAMMSFIGAILQTSIKINLTTEMLRTEILMFIETERGSLVN
jgi:hypothetical protein